MNELREKLLAVADETAARKVNHGKHTSPTLIAWANRIRAAADALPGDGGQREGEASAESWRDAKSAPNCPTIENDDPVRIVWRDDQGRRCTTWASANEIGRWKHQPTAANVPSGDALEEARHRIKDYVADMVAMSGPDWAALTNFIDAEFIRLASGRVVVDERTVLAACNAYNKAAEVDGEDEGAQYPWMHAALTAALSGREGG